MSDVVVENLHPGDRIKISSGALKDQEAIIKEVGPNRVRLVLLNMGCTVNITTILLVTPADHIIEEGEAYNLAVTKAISLARSNYLVTFGIQPTITSLYREWP